MRTLIAIAAAALLAGCAPAFAQSQTEPAVSACVPVTALIMDVVRAEIPAGNIYATKDVGIVNAYIGALGIGIPDGSEPIGMITVEVPHVGGQPDRVFIALVEPGDCIRHTGIVAVERHRSALAKAVAGTACIIRCCRAGRGHMAEAR